MPFFFALYLNELINLLRFSNPFAMFNNYTPGDAFLISILYLNELINLLRFSNLFAIFNNYTPGDAGRSQNFY